MRLGDLDALKKEIERTFDMQDLYLPVHFLDLIDNAPTVEVQMGRMTNGVVIPIARPKGESYEDLKTTRDLIIKAFRLCDHNETGEKCSDCPYRYPEWNGAWEDDETSCWEELKKDVINELEGKS